MSTLFYNREEAGQQLAEKLSHWEGAPVLVLAIPRGGVAVGFPIAQRLQAPLDVIIPRKIRAPYNAEVSIGAVTYEGEIIINDAVVAALGISQRYLQQEVTRAQEEIARRRRKFRQDRPDPAVTGKTVIIVDDGMSTGFTLQATIGAVRRSQPERVVVAVPVGPQETVTRLRPEVDELVCLQIPTPFQAVSQAYRFFQQLSDEEVIFLLKLANHPHETEKQAPPQA